MMAGGVPALGDANKACIVKALVTPAKLERKGHPGGRERALPSSGKKRGKCAWLEMVKAYGCEAP